MHNLTHTSWIRFALVTVATLVLTNTGLAVAKERTLYNFTGGSLPESPLIFDQAGNLYGTSHVGGTSGFGFIFQLSRHGQQWNEDVLYDFCSVGGCNDGSEPYGDLILDASGNLYGTTFTGGTYNEGVVYELALASGGHWSEKVLYNFGNGTDGNYPYGGLVFDKQGNLYGTTAGGGTSTGCSGGCGTVFKLRPLANGQWKETILYSFCSLPDCSDGYYPHASVVLDTRGNIYGTTVFGGTLDNYGTVFELTPGNGGEWTESTLHMFQGSDGSYPNAGLVLDEAGNLYGAAASGGDTGDNGTVFQLTQSGGGQWTEKVLYNFCSQSQCEDGFDPWGGLIESGGVLYGTTFSGGSNGVGTVFELALRTDALSTLYSFDGITGANPGAALILDTTGNLYGVTSDAGSSGYGTAFEIIR